MPVIPLDETCDNCGSKIGKLETAHAWKDHVVCGRCRIRLGHYRRPNRRKMFAVIAAGIVFSTASVVGTTIYLNWRSRPAPNPPFHTPSDPTSVAAVSRPSTDRPAASPPADDAQKLQVFYDQRMITRNKLDNQFFMEEMTAADGIDPTSIKAEIEPMLAKARRFVFNELEHQDDLQIKLEVDRGDAADDIIARYREKQLKNSEKAHTKAKVESK